MIRIAPGLALLLALGCRGAPAPPPDGQAPTAPVDAAPAPLPPPAPRLALLVGVARYADPGLSPVPGAANDLRLMKDLLVDRGGFAEDQIVTLADAQATGDGIRDAFWRHLVARAGPGTVAVFHFSGHGRQVPDTSGDEPDGRDEALVPYDADGDTPAGSLLDDDLGRWLDALRAKGADVTVIVDACHSGSPTRGEDVARVAPALDALPPAGAPDSDPGFGLDGAPDRPAEGSLVVLSAARSAQRARDARSAASGAAYGALTWALTRTLAEAPAGITWRDVIEPVRHRVSGVVTDQTPQLAGRIDRVVFGRDERPPPPGSLPVVGGGDGLTLAAGGLHGVVEGSVWRLRGADGRTLGRGTAAEVGPLSARLDRVELEDAALRAAGAGWVVPPGTRALEQARLLRSDPPRITFEGPAAVGAWLEKSGIPITGGPAPLRLRVEGQQARFEWLDGRRLGEPLPDLTGLGEAALRWIRWLRLVHLEGGAPSRVTVELHGARRTDAGWTLRPGDTLHFVLHNADPKWVWHVNLLTLAEDGDVAQLWPRRDGRGEADSALDPGRTVRVPPVGGLKLGPTGGRAHTVDVVKLIVTRAPADFGAVTRGATGAGAHPLARWLAATRGEEQGLLPADDWGVETLWVHLYGKGACPE